MFFSMMALISSAQDAIFVPAFLLHSTLVVLSDA